MTDDILKQILDRVTSTGEAVERMEPEVFALRKRVDEHEVDLSNLNVSREAHLEWIDSLRARVKRLEAKVFGKKPPEHT